jgi:hypothetical protein
MEVPMSDLDRARTELRLSSSGGAPFLLAFACTLGLTGFAGFFLDVRTTALITLFQGNVALPLAFWLERRMSAVRMADDNPLKPLSIQLAMSQILALPVALFVFAYAPWAVPMAMAGIGAAHFLPYAWLQQTRLYIVLAIATCLGPLVMTVLLRSAAAPWVLLYLANTYVIIAALIHRGVTVELVRSVPHAPAAS